MSREVKRVALDFKWPMNIVWKGYRNPYSPIECKLCDGSGLNPETKKLQDEWYNFNNPNYISLGNGRRYNDNAWCNHITEVEIKALLEKERLWDFTRVPINEKQRKDVEEKMKNGKNSWLPYDNGYVPTPEEVNKWSREGMGHDSCNKCICVEARAKHLGVYGECELCDGKGYYWCDDKYEELYENFEWIQPPSGEGWQMWETTTEGSPISPVFETPEELARWLADNNASTFGKDTTTYENWINMIVGPGHSVCSMVSNGSKIVSGVDAVTELKKEK